jgi:uncharacterized protein with NRDE domain
MCLIFLSLNNHPTYKLIVAANRDEFYYRQTAPATYWEDHPDILGGRDLEAMGTWMAMTKTGKIAMVTNYRDPKNINPKAPTRGKLVSDYLIQPVSPERYLKDLEPRGKEYNGFNLVVGDADRLFYFSNYGQGILKIEDGFHGLSNHLLDTPWPKVTRVKEKFESLVAAPKLHAEALLDALYDEQRAPSGDLPDTGVGQEWEQALSSMFIKTGKYGTRCSTVVLINKQNEVTYSERVYNTDDFSHQENTFQFRV